MSPGQIFANAVLVYAAFVALMVAGEFAKTRRSERIWYAIAAVLASIPTFHIVVKAVVG